MTPKKYTVEPVASMLVHQAKNVARRWALEEATNLPGFQGVYFAGSINTMAEDAVLSPNRIWI